jgi:DNA-binding NtrC family response regulator
MTMSKRSILYLDDEAGCLDVFYQLFSDEYDIRIAQTCAEACRSLLERPADIIISDQAMPGMNGTDFLSEVARSYPQSIRMLLTGSICVGMVLPEISTGNINIFISKPWTVPNMRRALLRADLDFQLRTAPNVIDQNISQSSCAFLEA